MSVCSERISTENGIKEDCVLFLGVYLNFTIPHDCVLKRVKQIVTQNTFKSSCLLHKIERNAVYCSNIVTIVLLDHWGPLDCICFCEMPSKFSASLCLKEARLKPSGGVKSVGPVDAGRCISGYFLGVVLLLGIYITRKKTRANRNTSAHGSNSTMEIFFTMVLRCFSRSLAIHQLTVWVAVRMSFVLFLSWSGGRTVRGLIACRAARTVIKLLCRTQQQFRALPVTALLIWLTFSYSFPSKNRKDAVEDILVAGVRSTLGPWSVSGRIELLAMLLCGFISLSSLLQSILNKLNVLSVLLHVQLVTCQQNSRVPIKYVLVININRFI
ncbi:uncharacterized protein LOC120828091 [Gasterosteus aculeatus]